jgi:hypothetical protein
VPEWKIVRPLLFAALALAIVAALGALAYIKSGVFNVGAAKPHTRLTQWITEETMKHSIRRHASGIPEPTGFTAAQVVRGFCHYETH